MQYRLALSMAATVLLAACVGCNRRNTLDLQEVSGSVSFNAQLLENGTIQFSPLDPGGLAAGSAIAEGKYLVPRQKGLPPGKYTVRISAAEQRPVTPGPASHAPGDALPPLKELLPERYNSKSELTAEVKSGGGNVFDFELR